ncbi:MAG TPA: DUF6600 domain-containing protein, partial [Alphaproteobacteria bacterium]|nr:DUF6600 domain-containing protein [Alphaproteobacteria bacterium]
RVLSRGFAIGAGLLLLVLSSGAFPVRADTDDPPGRVGRLSYIEGAVSFRAADQDQWSPAILNYPVTSGASFRTEADARAEIQVGAIELRMDGSTGLAVVRLDDSHTEARVLQGVVNVHVGELPPGGIALDVSDSSISLFDPGRYRVEVANGADSPGAAEDVRLAVLEGRARLDTIHGSLDLRDGQEGVLAGPPPTVRLEAARATPFDEWARAREDSESASEAERYVSPGMTGYQDLDSYGAWQTVPTYGAVWFPAVVPAGWAPYRFGHWAFVQPWGWVWIDDARWGFAPFHFGRWLFVDGHWGWCPGERVRRPVFAPALVVFLGGSHWGVSTASVRTGVLPAVGWVPLAPFEVFRPSFRASDAFLRRVNAPSLDRRVADRLTFDRLADISVARLKNRRIATVVAPRTFTAGVSVHRARLAVPEQQVFHAPVVATLPHLRPDPVPRRGVGAPVDRARSPARVGEAHERTRSTGGHSSVMPTIERPRIDRERHAGPRVLTVPNRGELSATPPPVRVVPAPRPLPVRPNSPPGMTGVQSHPTPQVHRPAESSVREPQGRHPAPQANRPATAPHSGRDDAPTPRGVFPQDRR